MAIYIRAGREIYRKRRRMLNFSSTGTGTVVGSEPFSPTAEFSAAFNFKTTEVVQTTEIIQPPAAVAPAGTIASAGAPVKDPNVSYSVTISADHNHNPRPDSLDGVDISADVTLTSVTSHTSPSALAGGKRARVLSNAAQDSNAPPATSAGHNNNHHHGGSSNNLNILRRRNYEIHNATWSYTKCAILFFSVLLVTWIPSSGNRVYSMINGGDVSKPLFFASAFVLPLQGFWNAIIYIVTSWAACKSLWGQCGAAIRWGWSWSTRRVSIVEITDGRNPVAHRDRTGDHHHAMGRGRSAGMWGVGGVGRRQEGKEEGTSMEDLTSEGRAERVSPV